ncbi:MAG: preprotein translocase subunit SecA [Candidatus Pacebacteria bacterium]|nr:preprotein translocase subunit SecA [Candidatus Paceibacterota bacterium]
MFKFLKSLFDEEQKKLKKYQVLVDQINAFEPEMEAKNNKDLALQTKKFKEIIEQHRQKIDPALEANSPAYQDALKKIDQETLELILPEAYATVREVSRRLIGVRHFDVQMLAGVALHRGNITEQKTGEGKTLTVTCPLYLNALLGHGAHLVTVNDYLSEIGVGWMGPIYHFLGLKTAVIVHDHARLYDPNVDSEERGDERLEHFVEISRQEAYLADITYGTNNEFGFDYLRDNMVQNLQQMVQRQSHPHHFAIVDEADSILIDEARTPLIISAPDTEPTNKYYQFADMVRSLSKEQDYKLDEKSKSATLTDLGVKRLEAKLGVSNLYEENFDTIHHIEKALQAQSLYHKDKEYIIKDNQIIIVDEHTGRLMFGRRYSDGLHQAIEAKEGVAIQQESRTLATISLQNYFRMYQKLSGMTGTALTESEEFNQIYHTDVLAIPTNEEVIRQDRPDQIYKNTAAKYSAIVKEVERLHETGQPILLGTRSIEHNQIISNFLRRKKIDHQLLNAKNHEREAFIIADAGKKGAITVATNIAGRGVDIVLGGAKPELKNYRKAQLSKKKSKIPAAYKDLDLPSLINPANYKLKEYAQAMQDWQEAHQEVVEVGGLAIIGTERHESRRIDNQLRGRSGRQGDPGSSQFFVSLDDEIMRIFGGEQIAKLMNLLQIDEQQVIENKMVSKAIESAQTKVETFFFDQRKRLVDFDDVMNKHREIIYKRRRRLLEVATISIKQAQSDDRLANVIVDEQGQETTLKAQILDYIQQEVTLLVNNRLSLENTDAESEAEAYQLIVKDFTKIIPFDEASQQKIAKKLAKEKDPSALIDELMKVVEQAYESREAKVGEALMRELEKFVILSTIDEKWMDHLDMIDDLRQGIWLRGDKNTVLSEYKREAFKMFEELINNIQSNIATRIFRIQPLVQQQSVIPKNMQLDKADVADSLLQAVAADPRRAGQTPSQATGKTANTSDLAKLLANANNNQPSATSTNRSDSSAPTTGSEKIGRNDPCPCGSGLKYKKCGLIGAKEHRP